MKKLIIFTLMFLFLFSYVSAVRVDYSPNDKGIKDMKAVVKDTILFGLISVGEQGTMELKSHNTIYEKRGVEINTLTKEVNPAGIGLIYETNFGNEHKDALTDVKIIDMRTGKEVERDWRFVYSNDGQWEIPIYKEVCSKEEQLKEKYERNCEWVFDYYKYEPRKVWNVYDNNNIPKGKFELGIEIEVKEGDYLDIVLEIQGKEINKHAQVIEGIAGYIYAGGSGNQSVVKYDKDFNIVAVSPNYGSTINSVITDDDYVYYVGWDTGGLKKAYKENLTQIYSLSNYRDRVVYVDDLYLYRGGSENKVVKYNKTNGAYISEFSFGNVVWSITSDDTYLYTGGRNKVDRRNKHDFSSSSSVNPSGGGFTYALYLDENYLYVGGNYNDAPHLRKLNKTNLAEIGTGVSGINVQSIVIDDDFIYTGGLTSGNQLIKSYKSNLSIAQTTSSYQGIYELAMDNNFIYLAGVDQRVKQVYKTNLSLFANFPSYGGELQSVTLDAKIVLNINLTSPINNYETNINTINFEAEIEDNELGVTNVSLVINGSIIQTNSSGLNGTYNFLVEDLEDGYYEWYVEAYDDTDEYYTSETRYFTIDTTPFIEFVSPTPANASNLTMPYIPVNVSVTEDYFENITFYFYKDGVLNESITFTDDTRFYNKTGCTNGNWEINTTVCTTNGACNFTETRYFTIDATPFIEFVSPTPDNASNLTMPYIPVNVSVTEDYFENITFYFYKDGVLNESITFTDDTRFYNKTGCTNGNWEINATICTTTSACNSTETRLLIIDSLAPEIEISSPVTSYNYLHPNQTIDLKVTITDEHLDSCWYKYPDEDYQIYSNYFYSPFENITIDTYSYLIVNVTPSGDIFHTTTTYELGYCNNLTFSDEGNKLYLRCDDEEPINLGFVGDWGRSVDIFGYNLTYFNCSENQTFNYIPDQNTLTVYANDTFGNEKNESVSWDYKLLVLDTVYDEEAISTKYNDITLVTKTQGDTTLNTVTLKYNNSNIATVETKNGNYSNFTARVHKAVTSEQVFNFSYNVTLQYPSLPSTNFEINHYNQTYIPLFFGRCNATYNTNTVNFTVYEEGTSEQLNASHESNLRLWIDGTGNSIYQLAAYQNLAQNESNYDFCISPTDETFYSSGLVSNYRDDADRRDYFLSNFSLNNESQEIPIYLAFTSETDIVTLIVYDSNYNYLEDATIYVQRWIVGTETFENIAILDTDSNGETFINLILYDVYYRFLVYYDGKLVKTTNSERLSSTTKEIQVVLGPENNYEPFDNIVYDLTFNNATNVVTFSFVDSSGALASGCLKVYNSTVFGEVLLTSECSTSASATISSLLETNNTYIVRGIITLDDDYDEVSRITQLIITIGDNIPSETMGSYGYMLAILLLGTMFVVGVSLGYPEISFITTGIVMIFINMLGWLAIPTEVLVLYFSIFLLFIIIGGKK